MVSRRNFVTIAMTMLILCFMFQFTGVAKQMLNQYSQNAYEESGALQFGAGSAYYAGDGQEDAALAGERPYILFVGGEASEDIRQAAWWWCTYSKRGFVECGELKDYSLEGENLPQAAVIDGECLELNSALPVLEEMTDRGIHLIFARLPRAEDLVENQRFRDFLGIRNIYLESVELSGIHLFQGFLLGSEKIYEERPDEEERMDLDLEVPWYMTGSGTKTYIMGMVGEEGEYQNEMLPAIVWRKSTGSAKIFCVNADYISHMYGMGFLSAMMADADTYEVYPVINAQNLTLANFSGFADENGEELKSLYSQSQTALYRELIWPAIVSVTQKSNFNITMMSAPQLDYGDGNEPDSSVFTYYLKLLKEEYGEAGVSMDAVSDIDVNEKAARDEAFYREGAEEYGLLSLYVKDEADVGRMDRRGHLSKIRTVVAIPEGEKPIVDYIDGNLTLQHATDVAEEHTYTDDLALMGIETALGYTNIVLDVKNVSYPRSSEDYWENLSRSISQNVCTYWKDYEFFASTTLAESDARARRFLALDFRSVKEGNQIIITCNDVGGPVWFLLKVNGETAGKIQGGTMEELGSGYYLVETAEQEVIIELEGIKTTFYE